MPLKLSDLTGRKKHKYGAVPVVVDGIRFDSTKEAKRWTELRMLEQAGEITHLERQPMFPLYVTVCGERIDGDRLGIYRGDFRYRDRDGLEVVEDVKGYDSPLSKWKRRHVRAQYGIDVQIV